MAEEETKKEPPKKEHNLKEYLEGTYTDKDGLTTNEEVQYRSRMRIRVKRDMRFLKLVLEKADRKDLYMIFSKDEEEWNTIIFPVISRLLALISDYSPSEMGSMKKRGWLPVSIRIMISLCEQTGEKFGPSRFLENIPYRRKKVEKLAKKLTLTEDEKKEIAKWTSVDSKAEIKEIPRLFGSTFRISRT
jgi:hypothetical protein